MAYVRFFAILMVVSVLAPKLMAAQVYETNRHVVFTSTSFQGVTDQGGVKVWQSPDGRKWSSCLGRFSNSGVDTPFSQPLPPNHSPTFVNHSAAADACEKIGAQLPLIEDFAKLYAFFETTPGDISSITSQDLADFQTLFPECFASGHLGSFWTASGFAVTPRFVDRFDSFGDPRDPRKSYLVRCVDQRSFQ